MSWDREKSLERQIRAFQWVGMLADLPGRLAGSAGEREAAERVEAWIRDLGVDDVRRVPVASGPRPGMTLALHLGLAALGCAMGGALGAALAVLAAWSFRRELRADERVLTRPLAVPPSVNVIARAGARHPTRRLVLSAHIDTAQAGWLFAPALADAFARRARRGPHAVPELMLLAGAAVTAASWLGAEGWLVGAVRGALAFGLAIGAGLGLQWARSAPTPGANDNASAVAALLTCAEQLLGSLPDDAELWIVATGAEEVGCRGMRAFLDEHPDWPVDSTWFLNFECVGGGALHWVRSEGTLGRTAYPPVFTELARRVAASGVFGAVTPTDLIAGTDGSVPAARGYPALSLISLEANGVPRRYHRPDDVPEGLDMPTVIRAADFAAGVARAALSGAAAPIAIL